MARVAVFISYSSFDEAFAVDLRGVLEADHEVWIDSAGIPAGTAFRDSIRAAIESCEVMIVVLTEAWLTSTECLAELDLAVGLHKRVIPAEPHRLGRAVPPGLDGRSPIGFWREGGRDAALAKLRHDLVADHDWLGAHRDLLVDALRWRRSGGPDLRLRGPALRAAVRMVEQATAGGKVPDLVPVQREYVQACEAAEAAEVDRLTTLNRRATARHLLAEAQRLWAADRLTIGLALRLVTESLRRAPGSTARSLANELVRTFPVPLITLDDSAAARQLAFSRDGRYLAVAGGPRVQVWATARWTRAVDRTLDSSILQLRFDGSTVVVLSADGSVQRIPPVGGTPAETVGIEPDHAVLAPDGGYVAWARRRTVFVQPTGPDGGPAARYDLPLDARHLAFSAAGRHLVVCAAGNPLASQYLVRLIDLASGATRDLDDRFHMDPVFSPDGRFVAARGPGATTVWRVADGVVEAAPAGDLAAWYPDSRSAIVTRERLMRLDDPPSPRHELLIWTAGQDDLTSVLRLEARPHPVRVFTSRGRTLIGFSTGRGVRVVDARLGTVTAIVPQTGDLSAPLFAITSRGDRLATAADSEAVRVFDLAPEDDRTIGPFVAAIGVVAASPDGRWIARSLEHAEGTDFGSLMPVEVRPGSRGATAGRVSHLAVGDDGSVAAVTVPRHVLSPTGDLGAAALVVVRKGVVREWRRAEAGRALAISPDGRWVAEIGADGTVRRIDADTPDAESVMPAASGATGVRFDGSGRFLLAFGEDRISVYEGAVRRFTVTGVTGACFEGADRLWVAGDTERLAGLALPGGNELSAVSLPFVPTAVESLGTGGRLLAVHDRTVVLVDGASGAVLGTMQHLEPVVGIVCSPSRRYVLATTRAGRSTVWDTDHAVQVFEIDEPYARAVWLSGDRLAVVRGDRLQVEPASLDELLSAATVRGGTLTLDEWRTYLPDEPWPGGTAGRLEE